MASNILEMRGITKTFPGVKALSDVDLQVRQGEIHAICGENGAGKSTLMKVLSGVYPYGTYEGEIHYNGEEARFGSINDSEHAGVVIIHQELALVPYLTVAENIFLGNERRGRLGLIDWNQANHEATELMHRVGLDENPTTPVRNESRPQSKATQPFPLYYGLPQPIPKIAFLSTLSANTNVLQRRRDLDRRCANMAKCAPQSARGPNVAPRV